MGKILPSCTSCEEEMPQEAIRCPKCGNPAKEFPIFTSQEILPPVKKPKVAFVISMAAGLLILLNGVVDGFMGALLLITGGPAGLEGLHVSEIAWNYFILMTMLVTCGLFVLVGAALVYRSSTHRTSGGLIILVFSVLSFFVALEGGFLVGWILGIIGAILALWRKPMRPAQPSTI